ncbi:MAG: 3-keto-disaccharide hydrolase [Phycisphaeraceae bacterium]
MRRINTQQTTPAKAALALLIFAIIGLSQGCTTRPSTDQTGFVSLFDGKTLDGWRTVGGNATFRVEDGDIVGTSGKGGPNTFLRTVRDDYRDFEFRCEFKWDIPGNSGIQFRSGHKPPKPKQKQGTVFGYQYEMDHSERAWSAGVHEESRRGWMVPLKGDENAAKRKAVKLDDWNDAVIRCQGSHIQTWLNGMLIADLTDDAEEALPAGFFGLQIHWGELSQVRWRNLRIKELNTD